MAEQSVPDSDVFLTREIGQKVFDAARECYERWRTTPNRDAYVGLEIERAARAAVSAVGADLIAAGIRAHAEQWKDSPDVSHHSLEVLRQAARIAGGTPERPECVCDLIDVSAGRDIQFIRGESNGCRVHPDPRAADIAEAKRCAREGP